MNAVHKEIPPRETASSHLPALGRRGGGWVLLQGVFLVVAIAAGVWGPAWPPAPRSWLVVAGSLIALGGAGLLVAGIGGLGRQLTPFPRPVAGGRLRRDGVFGLVRHPMYGGALLVILGWALWSSPLVLVPLGLAAVFLDAKRRREEAWLIAEHPDYVDYRRAVPRQFIPWLW